MVSANALPQPSMDEMDDQSLIGQVSEGALSGLAALGNLLDLPGSMVRDLMVWDNPFDQWLDPLSHAQTGRSVTGREMLDRNLLTGWAFTPNKETGIGGWADDPLEGVQDVTGFLAELALDPLAWFTGGMTKAAGGAAKGITTASRAGKFARGVDRVGHVLNMVDPGTHVGRGLNHLGFQEKAGEILSRARGVAQKHADTAGQAITKRATTEAQTKSGKLLRGLAKGAIATKQAAGAVSEKSRLWANAAFDSTVKEATTALGQKGGRQATEFERQLLEGVNGQGGLREPIIRTMYTMQDLAASAIEAKRFKPDDVAATTAWQHDMGKRFVRAIEKNDLDELGEFKDALTPHVEQLRGMLEQLRGLRASAGLKPLELDDVVDFFPSVMNPRLRDWEQSRQLSSLAGSGGTEVGTSSRVTDRARDDLFRGFFDGRPGVNDLTADTEVHRLIREGDLEAAEKFIDDMYVNAGRVDPRIPVVDKNGRYTMKVGDDELSVTAKELESQWTALNDPKELRNLDGPLRAGEFKKPLQFEKSVEKDGKIIRTVGELITEERVPKLLDYMKKRPVLEEIGGVFEQNPLVALSNKISKEAEVIAAARSLPDVLTGALSEGSLGKSIADPFATDVTTLKELMDNAAFGNLDRQHVYSKLSQHPSIIDDITEIVETAAEADEKVDVSRMISDYMDNLQLDTKLGRDLVRAYAFQNLPSTVEQVEKILRSTTSLFKAFVLTAPARYTRDFFSGQIANMYNEMFSGTAFRAASDALFNRASDELLQLSQVQEYLTRNGLDFTPENATKAVREMYAIMRGDSSSFVRDFDNMEIGLENLRNQQALEDLLPGGGLSGAKEMFQEIGATGVGRRGGSWNPTKVAGFLGETETKNKFVRAGDIAGKHSDDMNRLVGFIERMRRGDDVRTAFDKMNRVQLDYSSKSYTQFEKHVMRKIFPFWSFFSKQLSYLTNELMTNPAGRLGQLIRLSGKAQSGEYLPDHVSNQVSIPFGQNEDGTQNYITGMGLMYEDAVASLFPTSGRDALRGLISKMNPIVKGPAEWALGRSSFQGGPLGGRDIDSMDPVIGRILTQLGVQDALPGGQAAPVGGSRAAEFIASNSPVSRILSSTRTALDDRKTLLQRAINLTTGMRVTSVSPEQRRRGLRELTDSIARDSGARSFETFHISDELIESVPDDQARILRAIKELRRRWDQRRKAEQRAAE